MTRRFGINAGYQTPPFHYTQNHVPDVLGKYVDLIKDRR